MCDYTGEDLLKVFTELDVHLLDLDTNVVKAWFDTDDTKMKDLLNWMCSSLSKQNYISPLEIAEYNTIEKPLADDELEAEKENIDHKYPGIFDIELNELEIEFLEADLQLAQQHEKELDEEICRNMILNDKLSKKLNEKVKEEIESSVQLKITQEKCLVTSQKLDKLNKNIHEQITKCSTILHKFQFSTLPIFINHFDINVYQEKIDNMLSMFPMIVEESTESKNDLEVSNITFSNTLTTDDTAYKISKMYKRLLHSQNRYLVTIMEVEKIKAILAYLDKVTIQSLLSCDSSTLKENISIKMDMKTRLCDVLYDSINRFVEFEISQSRIKYMEQEIIKHRDNLTELTQLEETMQKLVAHYSVLWMMYNLEKQDIENVEKLFHKVIHYVNRDMESSVSRSEKMKEIIENYKKSSLQENFKFLEPIVKILSSNETDFSLSRAHDMISNLNVEVDCLEKKLFLPCFKEVKRTGEETRKSVKVLKSFLMNGPTHRVLIIPHELQILIREVEELLKSQVNSVTSAMAIVSSSKKSQTKWQNYKRQLWMYFYADPEQMKVILQEIQDKFKENTKHF